jgi:predicted molibdopterin-dependent oxidoreductase YjgC
VTALDMPQRLVTVTVDGAATPVPAGSNLLGACRWAGVDVPTLCYLETLTPANTCRLCVVEVEGSRTLVPACSRTVDEGMEIRTGTDRVRDARRLVLEFLASSVDLSLAPDLAALSREYGADPDRFGPAATVADRPVKVEDDLYVRDYAKCVLCYRCVQACGEEAQGTFAISVAGRGFDAVISAEYDVTLPESACVYCGNCIGVCPTGALIGKVEYDMRHAGTWDGSRQEVTRTVCPFCGVGCNLDLRTQDGSIVDVTSPLDHDVTSGHLCVKGRFGWQFVAGDA